MESREVFTSGLMTKEQVDELFDRAYSMVELDEETGEHDTAKVLSYLGWADEEVVANEVVHV
jgi:hypothetical protein